MGFDGRELDTAEIDARRHPSRGVPVEVLPLGFGNSALNGFYDGRLRTAGSPETSGNTKCQRANGNRNQRTAPAALKPSLSMQFHPLSPATANCPDYTTSDMIKHTFPRYHAP